MVIAGAVTLAAMLSGCGEEQDANDSSSNRSRDPNIVDADVHRVDEAALDVSLKTIWEYGAAVWRATQEAAATPTVVVPELRDDPRVGDGVGRSVGGDGYGDIEALICSYAWDCGTALRIARCESGLDPGAIGAGSIGLMQIQAVWHHDKLQAVTGRVNYDDLLDPHINLEVAWIIYADQGWGPWSCY